MRISEHDNARACARGCARSCGSVAKWAENEVRANNEKKPKAMKTRVPGAVKRFGEAQRKGAPRFAPSGLWSFGGGA